MPRDEQQLIHRRSILLSLQPRLLHRDMQLNMGRGRLGTSRRTSATPIPDVYTYRRCHRHAALALFPGASSVNSLRAFVAIVPRSETDELQRAVSAPPLYRHRQECAPRRRPALRHRLQLVYRDLHRPLLPQRAVLLPPAAPAPAPQSLTTPTLRQRMAPYTTRRAS